MDIAKDQVSFHDSSLVSVRSEKNMLSLYLEDVQVGERECSMTVTVDNIENLTRDNLQLTDFRMETNDGEVLQLGVDDDVITLVVTWHKHAPRCHETHTYQMSGKAIKLGVARA